jgi:hypothetical protein
MNSFYLLKVIFLIVILSFVSFAQTYYVTETGKKFHYQNCRFVGTSSKAIELKDAVTKGYEPCGVCKPGGEALAEDYYRWKSQQDSISKSSGQQNLLDTGNKETEKKRCKGQTLKGKQCKRSAEEGSDYCWQHTK